MSTTTEQTREAQSKTSAVTTGDEPSLVGHGYDGIQEFDNPLPGWWTWLFVGTIVFSVIYFGLSMMTDQFTPRAEYAQAKAADDTAQLEAMKLAGLMPDRPTLLRLQSDAGALSSGSNIFATSCAPCHAPDGSGMIGPNLTDDFYIHVKKIEDFPTIVSKGVEQVLPNGNKNILMPPWAGKLSPNDIVFVSAYAASLRGKNLATKSTVRPNHEGAQLTKPWDKQ